MRIYCKNDLWPKNNPLPEGYYSPESQNTRGHVICFRIYDCDFFWFLCNINIEDNVYVFALCAQAQNQNPADYIHNISLFRKECLNYIECVESLDDFEPLGTFQFVERFGSISYKVAAAISMIRDDSALPSVLIPIKIQPVEQFKGLGLVRILFDFIGVVADQDLLVKNLKISPSDIETPKEFNYREWM